MIIHSIKANNFLKYENLQLTDLPKQGVITVGGQNESGKTTIGETLCFALFGRTFTLEQSEPKKLIRWGTSQGSVTVEFTVAKDERVYRVDRYLDVDGTYGAKLSRDADGVLLGKGVEAVNSQLKRLIGFGYAEFIESFYLAQRELPTPHPHSQTIKVMAGIAPMAEVSEQLGGLIEEDNGLLETSRADLSEADQQIAALAIDESWMPELGNSQDALNQLIAGKQSLREDISRSAQSYSNAIPSLKRKWTEFRVLSFLGKLFTLSTLLFAGCWYVITRFTNTSSLYNLIANNLSGDPAQLFKVGIISLSLLLIVLVLMIVHRIRLKPLREQADQFSITLDQVINDNDAHEYPTRIQALIDRDTAQQSSESNPGSVLPSKTDLPDLNDLFYRSKKYRATDDEVTAAGQTLGDHYNKLIDNLGRHKLQHDFAIRDEQARLNMNTELAAVKDRLTGNVNEQSRNISVHSKGKELLESASRDLGHKFNQSILQLASKALPNFTRDRYKHLKIDEQLDVRVFSNEKGDFLDFDEISSGTQRQVMLAMRLAMSQQLIDAIECGKQFLFLDEPFAFFDQQRIRDTITALPEFSQDIQQIWLVAQEFPSGTRTKLVIECQQGQNSLVIPPTVTPV